MNDYIFRLISELSDLIRAETPSAFVGVPSAEQLEDYSCDSCKSHSINKSTGICEYCGHINSYLPGIEHKYNSLINKINSLNKIQSIQKESVLFWSFNNWIDSISCRMDKFWDRQYERNFRIMRIRESGTNSTGPK